MIIKDIRADWIQYPIPTEGQHISDFGRIKNFDMVLVSVFTDEGLIGYGEAKAAVGSQGNCSAIVATVEQEIKPLLVGKKVEHITRHWHTIYNGPRNHYAFEKGRGFPILGRRGYTICALGAVDTALWDLLGKSLNVPVVQLLGGSCREKMPVYASGGWADSENIGEQLHSYVEKGFQSVKMRVGAMDKTVQNSIKRVKAARKALGDELDIMVDAHGTFSLTEAKYFCRQLEDSRLRWFEEPLNSDSVDAIAELHKFTSIPISMGESEFTAFDIKNLIDRRCIDIVQPDMAIIGGITEGKKITQLTEVSQLELAPHLWGSAFSFMAGMHIAFSSPSAIILEFSLGYNPFLTDLVQEEIKPIDGFLSSPEDVIGLGVTPNLDFVNKYKIN